MKTMYTKICVLLVVVEMLLLFVIGVLLMKGEPKVVTWENAAIIATFLVMCLTTYLLLGIICLRNVAIIKERIFEQKEKTVEEKASGPMLHRHPDGGFVIKLSDGSSHYIEKRHEDYDHVKKVFNSYDHKGMGVPVKFGTLNEFAHILDCKSVKLDMDRIDYSKIIVP